MKINILSVTLAAALALSTSIVFAQQSEEGNGLNLGKSMPGSTSGVQPPDRAATPGTAPVAASGAMGSGMGRHHRKHRKHHHQM
jgi:hypothetical protein